MPVVIALHKHNAMRRLLPACCRHLRHDGDGGTVRCECPKAWLAQRSISPIRRPLSSLRMMVMMVDGGCWSFALHRPLRGS